MLKCLNVTAEKCCSLLVSQISCLKYVDACQLLTFKRFDLLLICIISSLAFTFLTAPLNGQTKHVLTQIIIWQQKDSIKCPDCCLEWMHVTEIWSYSSLLQNNKNIQISLMQPCVTQNKNTTVAFPTESSRCTNLPWKSFQHIVICISIARTHPREVWANFPNLYRS